MMTEALEVETGEFVEGGVYNDMDYGQTDPLELLQKFADADNICEFLEKDELGRIGTKVIEELDIDKGSRYEWDERMKEAMDLAMQVREEKTWPWPNAANVKYPLLTTAAIQFNARAYPAIVPGKDIVKCKVNGDDSGLYQPITDPQTGQPALDEQGQPAMQEIVPPGAKQARADRVGRHMSFQLGDEMTEWEPDTDRLLVILPILGVAFRKTYYGPGKGQNCSEMILPSMLYINYKAKCLEEAPRITQEFTLYPYEITERFRSEIFEEFEYATKADDHDEPQVFYEQHRRLDLDNDSYPEPYIVTVHKDTKTVVRIVARFYPEDVKINQGKVMKITPIHYFTKYGFIPNPESAIYDLGFGMLLNPINESVNSILNQMLDAGTIQNAGGGFIGRGLRIKGGPIRYRPGEYKPVDVASGAKIAENIYHMQHPGPSAVLFNLLGLLIEAGKEITSTKDILTGEASGANASPTTTIAMIEQGLKAFTAVYKRVHRSLKSELDKLYALNRRYLPQESYFTFFDSQEGIAQQDYADDQDVSPVSDPTVVTDMQRMAKAQFLGQYKGDPFVNQMEIRRREMDAAGIDDIDNLLQEPSDPGPPIEVQLKFMELELEGLKQKNIIPSEVAKNLAAAIKDIAEAESKEAGIQIEAYRAVIDRLAYENQERAISGVVGQSSNGGLPALPSGPGGGGPQTPGP